MENEYLSVKEFAKKAGVTPQAVYQQFNKSLKPFNQVLNGKKTIHINALSLFDNKQDSTTIVQPLNNYSSDLLNSLKAQIESLNEQIKIKDGQIAELSEMNRNAQVLLLNQQKLLLPASAAEAAAEVASEPDPQPKKRPSFWNRIFK